MIVPPGIDKCIYVKTNEKYGGIYNLARLPNQIILIYAYKKCL